jgi:hypothetical protein
MSKGITSKETVGTKSYGKKLFCMVKFPEFLGRPSHRRLRNELKRATDNAKKEYLENIRKEIMEYQRTGRFVLMYIKTKELGWKETQGIQNIGI